MSIIKSHWSRCIDVNEKFLIGRCCKPKTRPPAAKVYPAWVSLFKLSQQPLLQLLLCVLPQRHVGLAWCAGRWLETFLEAAHQTQKLLLLVSAVELSRAPLTETLRKRDNNEIYIPKRAFGVLFWISACYNTMSCEGLCWGGACINSVLAKKY